MRTKFARLSCLQVVRILLFSLLPVAELLFWTNCSKAAVITTAHDPNQNGVFAASTTSECTGFITVTIKYTIDNESMENLYTIDWKTVPFRITNVKPNEARSTTISSTFFYSCPEVPGSVDWIDEGVAAPARGTQTFPAPHHKLGFVTLEALNQALSFNSSYSIEDSPVLAMINTATPLDPIAIDGIWSYSSSVINFDTVPHSFTNTLLPRFFGTVGPGQSSEFTFDAPRPGGIKSGALFVRDTGDIFPVAGFQPVPEPSTFAVFAIGAGLVCGIRHHRRTRAA